MTSDNAPTLIGSVFEREPLSKPSASSQSRFFNSKTGFPPVQHRAQKNSAFLNNREKVKRNLENERHEEVPLITTTTAAGAGPGPRTMQNQIQNDWRSQISVENEAKVQAMTKEEREAEVREILDRFGPSVGEILRRAKEKREAQKDTSVSLEEVPLTSEREPPSSPAGSPGTPLVSSLSRSSSVASTRPNSPSRASRKLRFAELAPDQVYVYPSAPSSPKKHSLLALPPPEPDSDAVSLGVFKGNLRPASMDVDHPEEPAPEEGTPEDIRKKYFPTAPEDNPDLAWIVSSSEASNQNSSGLRFDLTGTPIPSSKTLSLPTHLGLHHHAEGTRAGYTLDDIFLLTRSTVRAQRAAMFEVLVGVLRWLRTQDVKEDEELKTARRSLLSQPTSPTSKTPPLLKRILFAGLEALPERGVVGVRAMDLVWECLVGRRSMTEERDDLEYELGGMEEETADDSDLIKALPVAEVLPQLLPLLVNPPDSDGYSLESESQSLRTTPHQQQILSILTRLARRSNSFAETIVSQSGLVEGLLKVFIIPPTTSSSALPTPNTSAIRFLSILASASRTNAEILCDKIGAGDALLRFVVLSLDDSVLTEIMQFYTALARYGMYSRVAGDAKEVWWKIGDHAANLISSSTPTNLRFVRAYAALVESWIVCATDPHRTTPSHELLWSQVKGWEWGAGLASLLVRFHQSISIGSLSPSVLSTYATLWRSLAAFLEGAKVNGVRGGEDERTEVALTLTGLFESPLLTEIVRDLKQKLEKLESEEGKDSVLKDVASLAGALYSAIRLWLGCCSSTSTEDPPPFAMPFADISGICTTLVGRRLWRDKNFHPLFIRPLTTLLHFFLRLSPRMPGSHPDLWMAQAFGILQTLQRGDEEYALQITSQILSTLTPLWAAQRGNIGAPALVWEEKGGLMGVLGPFLRYEVNPNRDAYSYISPLCPSPRSVGMSTTLRVPSYHSNILNTEWLPLGLPFHSDWTLSPFNHLLRSGSDHSIFKQSGALPDTWDASEVEVVRATLALARVQQEVLNRFASSLVSVVGTQKEDVVFGCMKVFMLEHQVGPDDVKPKSEGERSHQEVFRDAVVSRQMFELLEPFTVKASLSHQSAQSTSPSSSSTPLEVAALPLLGSTVPFYQFYTDLVSLYDSISFSHPLFARLLLLPTSMSYALDYRKLLWNDYSHLLKGIRVEAEDAIAGERGIEDWLYPVETDPEILSAYLRALIKYGAGLQGFLRLQALHHIAANIWPDFRVDALPADMESDEERRCKLLRAVVDQGGIDVVRDVLRYRQSAQSRDVLLLSACFEKIDESCRKRRCELIEKWCGLNLKERIKDVLDG